MSAQELLAVCAQKQFPQCCPTLHQTSHPVQILQDGEGGHNDCQHPAFHHATHDPHGPLLKRENRALVATVQQLTADVASLQEERNAASASAASAAQAAARLQAALRERDADAEQMAAMCAHHA